MRNLIPTISLRAWHQSAQRSWPNGRRRAARAMSNTQTAPLPPRRPTRPLGLNAPDCGPRLITTLNIRCTRRRSRHKIRSASPAARPLGDKILTYPSPFDWDGGMDSFKLIIECGPSDARHNHEVVISHADGEVWGAAPPAYVRLQYTCPATGAAR